jgi:hypothetical protein
MTMQSQVSELTERLQRLYSPGTVNDGGDTDVRSESRREDHPATGQQHEDTVSPPVYEREPVENLLDELEQQRQLLARGFDEKQIRDFLKNKTLWNAVRYALCDDGPNNVDAVRRRAKKTFPQVRLGMGVTAREVVHVVKLADAGMDDLGPAERPSPVDGGVFTRRVEEAILERRTLALKKNPLSSREDEDNEARRVTSARTVAEQRVDELMEEIGIVPDIELETVLVAAVWRGFNVELGGRDTEGRPWIHVWRARSSSARIELGASVVVTEIDGRARFLLARRTDVDAVRENATSPTVQPADVVRWLGLDRPI